MREDTVIDPEDGSLIGRRSRDAGTGSVTGTDVITHGMAEKIGEAPVR